MPMVGFLRSTPEKPFAHIVAAFRQGLKETGFVEDQNVSIEQRWADNQLDRLPELAAALVRREAAVIVCNGLAVEAARSAAAATPIVFVTAGDPVTQGLVTNLNRPGGNLTGLTFFGNRLGAKRLEMLRELIPGAGVIAALVDPNFSEAVLEAREVEEAARNIGQKIVVVNAANEHEFDAAFTTIVQAGAGALVVMPSCRSFSGINYFLTLIRREARRCIKVLQWEAKSPQSGMDKRRDDFHEKALARHGRRVRSSEHCWLCAVLRQGQGPAAGRYQGLRANGQRRRTHATTKCSVGLAARGRVDSHEWPRRAAIGHF
jgi:hypothetical protein